MTKVALSAAEDSAEHRGKISELLSRELDTLCYELNVIKTDAEYLRTMRKKHPTLQVTRAFCINIQGD